MAAYSAGVTVTTRFAPSPTGRLHVGNIRAALQNWLWARASGGRFLLRLDDTDAERSTEAFAESIRSDLAWLGLVPDAVERQSERGALYEARFGELRAAGRIYPAYETAQELDLKRKIQLGRGLPPVYDRAALELSDADREKLEAEGQSPHWRFRLDHAAPVVWHDLIRGEQRFDPALLSDPVVRRADGSWLYMLPSVIDDIDMAISHVVRGEDHVANTALQLQMFEALGSTPLAFAHAPLLAGTEGKLSKRLGSLGVDDLRSEGIEPIAILALLARIGTSDPIVPVPSVTPLIEGFDFSRIGRAPARFDPDELTALNARIIHQLEFDTVRNRLPANMDAAAWNAIRPNLATVAEAADWWAVVEGPIGAANLPEDAGFLAEAATVARTIAWDAAPWAALVDALKATTGRKGKALFLPLRRALTGRDHGPEMAALLPLIGRDRAITRLEAASQP
jgi:glutamyl-tRNA synthetase